MKMDKKLRDIFASTLMIGGLAIYGGAQVAKSINDNTENLSLYEKCVLENKKCSTEEIKSTLSYLDKSLFIEVIDLAGFALLCTGAITIQIPARHKKDKNKDKSIFKA